jgi:2-polyprenyl-6-methoxyphenol hydroxylase-like FAD-dependent oxidoreductase
MKIVICGAGIAGLTLADRMSTLGGEVVLLELAPGPRSQGYMIDFFGPGYDAAEAMGLLPAIEDVAYQIDEASFVDEHGRRRAGVRLTQFAPAGRLLDVMRPDLERVLRERLPPDVDLRFGTGPAAVADRGDGVHVTLDDGAALEADLLVGADGIHSTVRRLVFGEESRFFRYLGFHTAAFSFHAPAVHAAVRGRACLTDTVDRQMGFYGLRDGKVAAFAVHRSPDQALPDDVRVAVRDAYGGLGWVVPEALDRCPPPAEVYYDQVAQIQLPSWSKGRVVLVGDACYAVSLIAGQGASLGMAGAYLLAYRLARVRSVPEALAEYERLWRPVAEEKQRVGRAGARRFLPETARQLRLRRAVLRMARLPVIDRYVAASLTGKPTTLISNLHHAGGAPQPTGANLRQGGTSPADVGESPPGP